MNVEVSSFSEDNSKIAALKKFDPAAFVGDSKVPQEIYNFVLTLARVYNDIRDAVYGYLLLQKYQPEGKFSETPKFGNYMGIRVHFIRYHLGLVHELCELIKDNPSCITHEFFQSVVRQMSPSTREAWQGVVDVALNQASENLFGKALVRIRNKVSFHYDAEETFNGYKKFFMENPSNKKPAYMSFGRNMFESRLYFADAAAQGYFELRLGDGSTEFIEKAISVMRDVNFAVISLVHHFIQKRGFSFTEP